MRNRFLFMMVAILAVASNVLADNGLGTRTDNGLGTFITKWSWNTLFIYYKWSWNLSLFK